ncbi:ureidoglycolate lyase [Polymorphobacter sp.]|uniref:ureidoglycolate lyase n=1 Tax=Polymorphobacter sp. TaxID=1909290 RepID=UPI003F72C904
MADYAEIDSIDEAAVRHEGRGPAPTIITIPVQRATAEKLARYGTILGATPSVAPMPIDFYDGAVKVRRVADFAAHGDVEMPIVTLQRRPLQVRWMERHFKHTQGFIPLGGKPFVACFAPPNDQDLPDLDAVEAFLFDGSAGFLMHIGTWHEFPFALLDETNLMIILTRQATDGLVRDNVIQDEAQSEDLDKKDLTKRLNVRLDLIV